MHQNELRRLQIPSSLYYHVTKQYFDSFHDQPDKDQDGKQDGTPKIDIEVKKFVDKVLGAYVQYYD